MIVDAKQYDFVLYTYIIFTSLAESLYKVVWMENWYEQRDERNNGASLALFALGCLGAAVAEPYLVPGALDLCLHILDGKQSVCEDVDVLLNHHLNLSRANNGVGALCVFLLCVRQRDALCLLHRLALISYQ